MTVKMLRKLCRMRYFKFCIFILVLLVFWTFGGYLYKVTDEDFPEDVMYDIFIDETKEDHAHIPLDQEMLEEAHRMKLKKKYDATEIQDPKEPIILWWTEFTGEPGVSRACGNKHCFFTNNRRYSTHKNMKVFVFYGTDFSIKDLPLPRKEHHEWALFHEESPKNNFLLCHGDVLALFNHTSTFRRESDFPITTQHLLSLDWLEQKTYLKTTSQKNRYQEQDGLAPIAYVQSDCDPPSDRDEFVKILMNYIRVDSYGTCLNNKKLPHKISTPIEGMAHSDFYELLSHYKFTLAMENAVCNDYITEKLWRSLMVGSVPIVFGSSKVKDFLPDNRSAVVITDFTSAERLASYIHDLNRKDYEYEKLLHWKNTGVTNSYLRDVMFTRTWAPDDETNWSNFVDGFECHICQKVHAYMNKVSEGQTPVKHWATVDHYGCPKPLKFNEEGRYSKEATWNDLWSTDWIKHKSMAKALKECVNKQIPYCGDYQKMEELKKDF